MKRWFIALTLTFSIGGMIMSAAIPSNTYAVSDCEEDTRYLLFPAWYNGLTVNDENGCRLKSPIESGGISNYIWRIVTNIIEMGLVAVGYIAVVYIIYGGFKYMLSRGSPDQTSKALTMILNAIIGLVVSIGAVAIVSYLADKILK